MNELNLQLTAIYVEDPRHGGFTAFFAQLPNMVAEGETRQEATDNLFELVGTAWKDMEEGQEVEFGDHPGEVTRQSFELGMT